MKRNTLARLWPGVAMIAATYVFFLLYAEFGLLHLLESHAAGPDALRFGVASLASGGVLGCLLAGWCHDEATIRRNLVLGFGTCAVAAGLAVLPGTLAVAPLLTGLGVGWLTVSLAAALPELLHGGRLGLWTGVGTGLAYAFCNIPVVFTASPEAHARIAAVIAVGGAWFAWRLEAVTAVAVPARHDGGLRLFWLLLAVLAGLVALDSAVFLLVQELPALRARAWQTTPQLWTNAAVHGAAAVLAGWLLDRGLLRWVLGFAGAGLLVGAWAIARGNVGTTWIQSGYPAGVSFYSTALVALPALTQGWPGVPRASWRAAWLYLLAGWIGSGLGIGFALEQRARLTSAPAAAVGGRMDPIDSLAASTIALGRQVYVAEGCIHCHSQFVRPGTPDVLRWGPARPLSETLAGEPPLPGNRRQGPDLQNVGNRRSPEWNRLHLENPRALAPGSAMPAYGFLFRAGDPRGPALVAYLVSLGAETGADRAGQIAGWNLSPGDGDEARGAVLFQHWCAVCHGDDGRGRGPMAARLAVTPANLRDGPWPRTGRNDPVEARRALARMIKFGAPGTTMPGHETLRDAEIAALTARVAGLRLAAP